MLVFVASTLLLVLSLGPATPSGQMEAFVEAAGGGGGGSTVSEVDWSQCPRMCKCKWTSGKRTADCSSAEYNSLPMFPRPDLIQVLIMDNNPVRTLPPRAFQLTGLINVQKVFMRNCSLNDLHPSALGDLVILIELDLSDNNLYELKPNTFVGNVRLRKLRLAHNQIRSLEHFSFPTMGHLRLLDLSYNRLARVSKNTFSHLGGNLEVLHLDNNNFKRLDVRPFLGQTSLKSLTLQGNPWQCDCKLRDLWHWLQAKRLLMPSNSAKCAGPRDLEGRGLHELDSADHLACAPMVRVPQPRVSVSKGERALLPCQLVEGEAANVRWLRGGLPIKANRSADLTAYGQYYVIYTKGRWFNLSIENIQPPSVNDLYTCVASNEGGSSEANVTLVHSPSVATYVGDGEVSWLLTGGVASGVLVFLLISIWLVFCSVQRSRNQQHQRQSLLKSSETQSSASAAGGGLNGGSNGGLLLSSIEEKLHQQSASATSAVAASATASGSTTEAITLEEQQLRQTTALARAQRTKTTTPASNLLGAGVGAGAAGASSSSSLSGSRDPTTAIVTEDPFSKSNNASVHFNNETTTASEAAAIVIHHHHHPQQQQQQQITAKSHLIVNDSGGLLSSSTQPPPLQNNWDNFYSQQQSSSFMQQPQPFPDLLQSNSSATATAAGYYDHQSLTRPPPPPFYPTSTSRGRPPPPTRGSNNFPTGSGGNGFGGYVNFRSNNLLVSHDIDSGCFTASSSGNEATWPSGGSGSGGSGPEGGTWPSPSGVSISSPLSSTSSTSMPNHHPHQLNQNQQNNSSSYVNNQAAASTAASATSVTSNNTRLLAHTLENRKRVLQSLIREKSDTLV